MTTLTTRLKLTGVLGDRAFYDTARGHLLTIPTGAACNLQVGMFNAATGAVESTTGLATLNLEIYETRTSATLLLPAVSVASFGSLTAETWAAGSAQHATLSLTSEQTNVELDTGTKQVWAVIYGVNGDGERVDWAAGPVILFRTNAGGTGPTEEPGELYPTNAQMEALLASKADTTALASYVKHDAAQSLSSDAKQQARTNIAAGSQAQLDQVSNALDAEVSNRESAITQVLADAEAYTDNAIENLVNGSPAALDTLLELSAALGSDPNFAATTATALGVNAAAIAAEVSARESAISAAVALKLDKSANLGDVDSATASLANLGGMPLYGAAVENFLGGWVHNANGYGGAWNWFSIGTGAQGLWSNASILPNYPGAPTLYASNGSFFSFVAPSSSGASMVGVSFDFTFRTDYLGATTLNRYFVGWRNAASTTADVGSRGLFWEAGDTNWSLLHTTSAGVQTKIDTGVPYAANTVLRVIITVDTATQTTLELRRAGFSPVIVSLSTGFSMTGSLGLGFALWSTAAATNRFINPCRAVLRWPVPTL